MMRTVRGSICLLLAGLAAGGVLRAEALEGQKQESRLLSDRFNIDLGGYAVDLKTDVRIGFNNVLCTLIRLENDLDFESDQSDAAVNGFYRFGPKSAIEFGWLSIKRDSMTTIDEAITLPDPENPGGEIT